MKYKNILLTAILTCVAYLLIAQTTPYFQSGNDPKPTGKKWVKIDNMSDEFEGNILDSNKWMNTDPTVWKGRPPGLFMENTVSIESGELKITNYQFDAPINLDGKTWTHACGMVRSKEMHTYGYYECKMKASKTFLSSTFWLINRPSGDGCARRTTELDIQECIGEVTGNAHGMPRNINSNSHHRYWQTPSGCQPGDMQGGHVSLGGNCYDRYYVYGVWWKNKDEALLYLDGEYQFTINLPSDFNLPMLLNMVTETYDWNPTPANGGMTGSETDRSTYYKWVRSWKLENDDEGVNEISLNNPPSSINSQNSYNINVNYTASQPCDIVVGLWSSPTNSSGFGKRTVSAGSGTITVTVDADNAPSPGAGYYWKAAIRPINTDWTRNLDEDRFDGVNVTGSNSAHTYHVSKTGNDNNSGTGASPFLTISKAASVAQAGNTVIIHEGIYEEGLKPANSGTAGSPIIFQAAPNESVTITALQALNGWTHDRGSVYKTQVDWNLGQDNMIMNGNRLCDLARWPNNTDADPMTPNTLRNDGGSGGNVSNNAYLTDTEIPNINWTGGSVFFFGDKGGSGWMAWKEFITSSSSGRVNFNLNKDPSWIRTFHAPGDKGDYYLEGVRDALDYENEWYFNENTKTLYVQLPGGATPNNGQISMRRRTHAIDLTSRHNIEIRDLTVIGGMIEINGNNNTLYGVTSLYGSYTRGVFSGFSADSPSIDVKWNSNNTTIEHCHIAYGAATGIRERGDYTKILNSSIHDFNYLGSYDAPILARDGSHTTIQNCDIYRAGRDVIQIVNKHSEVAYNDISEASLIAHDCALLYTINTNLDLNIHHNIFHDTEARGNLTKSAGVYLDNDASDVKVHHNVIVNVKEWASIQINWNGRNIDVFNNTIWDGQAAMGAWHKAGTHFEDVRVWNNLTNMNSLEPQSDKQNNLIMGSNADPFVDKDNLDFRLAGGAAAIDYGKVIAGYTDGYIGAAPDVGAFESGSPAWEAGTNWNDSDSDVAEISFTNAPTSITSKTTYNVSVDYTASQARDIVVTLLSPNGYPLGEGTKTVSAGAATTTVTINLDNPPSPGAGYSWKAAIRPIGTSEERNIDIAQTNGFTVLPSNTITLATAPNPISPQFSYDVTVDYTASETRTIVVEFLSPDGTILRSNSAIATAGAGTIIVPLLGDPPSPGTGYTWRAYLRDIASLNIIDSDQINDVTVGHDDSVTLNNAPITIYPQNTYTLSVNYTAAEERDIVVELLSPSGFAIGEGSVGVPVGSGTTDVTVSIYSYSNPPNPNTTYTWRASVQSSEGWTTNVYDTDEVGPVHVIYANTISLNNAPTVVYAQNTYTLSVNYTASQTSEIVVELWSPEGNVIGDGINTVSAGTGTTTITIDLDNIPNIGVDYSWKAVIREVNATQNLDTDQVNNVIILPSDTIALQNAPANTQAQTTYTLSVNYTASQTRDIVVELLSPSGVIGEGRTTVSAGAGTTSVTINLDTPPSPSTDYTWKASLRDWFMQHDLATDELSPITILYSDTIDFDYANTPYNVPNHNTYTIGVEYTASQMRDVVVEFWSPSEKIGEGRVTVAAGVGTIPVTINLGSIPAPGIGYLWKASIRPVGTSASQNLDINLSGVTVANANTVAFNNAPVNLPNHDSYTVNVDYTASHARDIVVEFWSPNGWLGSGTKTVPAGSATTAVTVDLDNAPSPGTGYLWKVSIRPYGTDWTQSIDADQVPDVTVLHANTVAFNSAPVVIPAQNTYSIDVDYTASHARDVVVEFWSSNGWLGQGTTAVSAGTGTANVTIDLESAPAGGTGYIWKTSIRPIGTDWQENMDTDQVNNVQVIEANTITLNNAPTVVPAQTTYTISVNYTATHTRDIVVEFWSPNGWIGQDTETVPAGIGTANVTINLDDAPSGGAGYIWKASIRPVDTDWRQNIDTDQVDNVAVIDDTSIELNNAPTIVSSETSYTINVDYTAMGARDIVVEFWSPNGWLGQGTKTVPAGIGTTAVTINLNNAPNQGSSYIWKASIRPVGTDWEENIDADQVNNVTVISANSVALNNAPTIIPAQDSYTISVNYAAMQTYDVVVEMWSPSGWIGQGTKTVSAGIGSTNVTINLVNTPNGGAGYAWKASIRPVGTQWQQNIDADQVDGVTVISANTVAFNNAPTIVPAQTNYTLSVDYKSMQSYELIVELWSSSGWLGYGKKTVSGGIGRTNVTVNLNNAPNGGTGYIWKASIRPIGTDWEENIDTDQVDNVTIISANTVAFNNAPTIVPAQMSYSLNIDYAAMYARDIVVELWSPNGWIGQGTKTVPAGIGSTIVTINLDNEPNGGSGYIWKASIRPIGTSWQQNVDSDQINNVTVINGNTITLNNPPNNVLAQTSYNVNVNYTSVQARDVVVELWSPNGWIGQGTKTVPAGIGTTTVTVNLNTAPSGGTGYIWKVSIRPIGTDWEQNLDSDQVNNVTIVSGNTIAFNNAPTSVISQSSYTIKVNYSATQWRDIVVEFWSSSGWLTSTKKTVAPGIGSTNLTLNLSPTPSSGTGYIWKASIRPVGTGWQHNNDSDQVNNVTVRGSQLIADGKYALRNKANGEYLAAPYWPDSGNNYNTITVRPGAYNDQRWIITHLGNDVYTIKVAGYNRYLEVPYGRCGNYQNVSTWTPTNNTYQKWKAVKYGNYFMFKPLHCSSHALYRKPDSGTNQSKGQDNTTLWAANQHNDNELWSVILNADATPMPNTHELREVISSGSSSEALMFNVHPNPVRSNTDWLVDLKLDITTNVSLSIFSMSGKQIYYQDYPNVSAGYNDIWVNSQKLGNLSKGIYLLKVQTQAGTRTQKVVVY